MVDKFCYAWEGCDSAVTVLLYCTVSDNSVTSHVNPSTWKHILPRATPTPKSPIQAPQPTSHQKVPAVWNFNTSQPQWYLSIVTDAIDQCCLRCILWIPFAASYQPWSSSRTAQPAATQRNEDRWLRLLHHIFCSHNASQPAAMTYRKIS